MDTSKQFLDLASSMYERAVNGVLKRNLLLHFAYADFEEQQIRHEKVHQIYKKYLEIEDMDPSLVSAGPSLVTQPLIFSLFLETFRFGDKAIITSRGLEP